MKTTMRRLPPDLRDVQAKAEEQLKIKKTLAETAVRRCLATSDGKVLLKMLMDQCGYQKCSVQASKTTGQHLNENTQYNEGRRDLYISLRKYARDDTLFDVEVKGKVLLHELLEI